MYATERTCPRQAVQDVSHQRFYPGQQLECPPEAGQRGIYSWTEELAAYQFS